MLRQDAWWNECYCRYLDIWAKYRRSSHGVWKVTYLLVSTRCWSWSHYTDWGTDSHHCGCEGCWEREGDLHSVYSRWCWGGCRRGWEWGWNLWYLLYSTSTWEVRHLCTLWRRTHSQQPLPGYGMWTFCKFYILAWPVLISTSTLTLKRILILFKHKSY